MKDLIKRAAVFILTACLCASAVPAMAADTTTTTSTIQVDGSSSYVTISNCAASPFDGNKFYVRNAASPSVITFNGIDTSSTSIVWYRDGVVTITKDGNTTHANVDFNAENYMPIVVGISNNKAHFYEAGLYQIIINKGMTSETKVYVQLTAETKTAVPISSDVMLNGNARTFDAYVIDGSSYFRLRDLAYVFNGTDKQFEMIWGSESYAYFMKMGKPYTAIGNEMLGRGVMNQVATPFPMPLFLDGGEIQVDAYLIDGLDYYKLRDVASALDFGVTWNSGTSTIEIDTTTGYSE